MAVQYQMQTDAFLLLTVTLCVLIICSEDNEMHWFARVLSLTVGAACMAQAGWLLGVWEPSNLGYPIPRLTLDAALAMASVQRAFMVLKNTFRMRRINRRLKEV